ncbi:MAG: cupin domain-containing protein [Gammaproteobacteria bacterium]|nr:cupin domain-containing protein [Gammaproteobacteria bacterium]
MKNAAIKKTTEQAEYLTAERCHILELSNDDADPAVSIARARVVPGAVTRRHRLRDTVERYVLLSGTGLVEIDGIPAQPVCAGNVVWIPAGAAQRIRNTGDEDLVFLCICTPRFEWSNYEMLEE